MMTGLLPQNKRMEETSGAKKPSLTYRIDFEKNRLSGMTDGKDALQQAIRLRLMTERFEHLIYSWDYGCSVSSLEKENTAKLKNELETRIRRSLLLDDRIEKVEDFQTQFQNDEIRASFTVISKDGSFESEASWNL